MKVEQLTIRLDKNEPGSLALIAATLAEEGMNILSLSLSGPEVGIGVLRVIVNDAPRAGAALQEKGFLTSIDHVVVVATPDKPGGLAHALDYIAREGFNIEYLYAFPIAAVSPGLISSDLTALMRRLPV